MHKIYKSADELIGNTPILRLCNLEKKLGIHAALLAKLEYLNPAGSVKDRVAKAMIDAAEKEGRLKPASVIIEPTSGNTGIGLAFVAAARGYKAVIVMPENMSEERKKLMRAYGAQLVLTDARKGMQGAIDKANQLAQEIPDSIVMGQFENFANPLAHKTGTGPEIYNDTEGKVDIFVAGVGTGGTLTGVGEYLKEKNPQIKIVAVEPQASAVLSGKKAGPHKIQGIGAGFIPKILNREIYDEVIGVSVEDAYTFAGLMCECEGVLVGISSAAALCAAVKVAKRSENAGKNVVVLMPDSGERYLSTEMFK